MIAKKCLVSTMSVLYTTMLIVTCIVLVTTETITRIYEPLRKYQFKGFYTYLYGGSILFMCYIFFYVLRYRVRGRDHVTEQLEMENFIQQMMRATGLQMRESEGRPGDHRTTRRLALVNTRREDTEDKPGAEMVVKLMTSESEKSHGGIMMRLGAIGFGLGTLIYAGLDFVNSFETPYHCNSWNILSAVNPVLQMIFTFMQMYYIFMHSKLNINKNKIIAKFGLMHLIATNCCVWINTLVKESMNEIMESSEFKKMIGNETFEKIEGRDHNRPNLCDKVDILGDTIEKSSVYLFPFIIEFSMIGAHIVFNMWKNVGKKPKFAMMGENDVEERVHHPLDWSNSEVGLFLGLLSLVTLTITLILYFSLVSQTNYQLIAIMIINTNDTVINAMMIVAIIVGFVQVQTLNTVKTEKEDDSLLLIGASGEMRSKILLP